MKQITGILGNYLKDESLAEKVDVHKEQGTVERVLIDASKRKRSRIRTETDQGTDLGLVVKDPLNEGDVLLLDDERAVIVYFKPREAVVFSLPEQSETSVETILELGHSIGNHHWTIAVEDKTVYIPIEADKHIIENVLDQYLPPETTIEYEFINPQKWINTASDEYHTHTTQTYRHGIHSHQHTHDH